MLLPGTRCLPGRQLQSDSGPSTDDRPGLQGESVGQVLETPSGAEATARTTGESPLATQVLTPSGDSQAPMASPRGQVEDLAQLTPAGQGQPAHPPQAAGPSGPQEDAVPGTTSAAATTVGTAAELPLTDQASETPEAPQEPAHSPGTPAGNPRSLDPPSTPPSQAAELPQDFPRVQPATSPPPPQLRTMSSAATAQDVAREIQEAVQGRTQIGVYSQNVNGQELRQDVLQTILLRSTQPPDVIILH